MTDSGREIVFSDDPERAGVNNLLGIYRAITGKSEDEVLADFADARGYGDLKIGRGRGGDRGAGRRSGTVISN